jgi:hypothetical protein
MGMDSEEVTREINELHHLMADEEDKLRRHKIEVPLSLYLWS